MFHELHDRFDSGESNVCSGKKDGTNRHLYRDADGFIRDKQNDAPLLRADFVMDYYLSKKNKTTEVVMTKASQKNFKLLSKGYSFKEWIYDLDNKTPIAKVYKNNTTERVKIINLREFGDQPATCCDYCKLARVNMKMCGACNAKHYCCVEHQTLAWKEGHNLMCTPP